MQTYGITPKLLKRQFGRFSQARDNVALHKTQIFGHANVRDNTQHT